MYDLPYFKANNYKEVEAFMRAHPFIILCGAAADGRPVATHIPVLFETRDERLWLRGHFMRQTDHHLAFAQNNQALAIFTGSHAYVSASWYQEPKVASTWNYQAVHADGILHFGDEAMLKQMLHDLTLHFENNPDSPSLVKHLDPLYVEKHMKAIVGFEIEVMQIRHVFKLSQNRDAASFKNIVEKLGDSEDFGAGKVADEMEKWMKAHEQKKA